MITKSRYFTILLLFIAFALKAQEMPGKKDSISSSVLNEKRIIQVILPDNYKPGSKDKYDVLYVLDDGNIGLANDIHHFLHREGKMPSVIVVGLINIDRDKDF